MNNEDELKVKDMLSLKKHNFEKTISDLKKFSEEVPDDIQLKSFKTKTGHFGIFDYKITGNDINDLTNEIQKYLENISDYMIDFYKELGKVYVAFDTLDKEYIDGIFTSIKAAELASSQAKTAAKEALKNSSDIKKTIEIQTETLKILSTFKEKIDKVENLENIDKINSELELMKNELEDLKNINKLKDEEITKLTIESKNVKLINYDLINKKILLSNIFSGISFSVAILIIILHFTGVL